MGTVKQSQQEFVKSVRYYQMFQGALKDKKMNEIFSIINKPQKRKVRSFVSKDLGTARSALEAVVSRSFYAHAENSGLKRSVVDAENQSQSTRAGGPNSIDPRLNISRPQGSAATGD